jgi:hypothetical protein
MYSDQTRLMEHATQRQPAWDTGILERPRYFPRQLMTPAEMILEQDYFRDKLRRHNRMLHGWGVVCGAIVCRVPCAGSNGKGGYTSAEQAWPCPEESGPGGWHPWNVSVSSGYILGPYGDEILINSQVIVDVRKSCTTGVSGDICPPAPDPWCSDVIIDRAPGPLYLAVRYKEMATRPVRVQPAGCGCDDTACEYSRTRDGFEICTLDECPDSHREDVPEFACEIRPCPPCPDSPWVVLARIDVDANGILVVDNYDCRRILLDGFWCYPQAPVQDDQNEDQIDSAMLEERARRTIRDDVDIRAADLDAIDVERLPELADRSVLEIQRLTPRSTLGAKLESANLTIAQVGNMSREDFLALALQDVDPSLISRTRNHAEEVWERASRITSALEALRNR